MDIKQITCYLWKNSEEISFGGRDKWDLNTFTSKWLEDNKTNRVNNICGVYWFSVEGMKVNNFKILKKPKNLPKKGINFSEVSQEIVDVFKNNICREKDGELIFYNGETKDLFGRMREHFILDNDKTGALAMSKYTTISKYRFKVRFFHSQIEMKGLNVKDKEYIKKLLNDKTGRIAIESCWRTLYGWPILCKK